MPLPTTWYTSATIVGAWDQAPEGDALELLVGAALVQVQAYAPALAVGTPIPPNYLQAQLMQTRNLWNAQSAQAGGDADGGEFVLRPVPLDWQVKALLRPKTVPVIG